MIIFQMDSEQSTRHVHALTMTSEQTEHCGREKSFVFTQVNFHDIWLNKKDPKMWSYLPSEIILCLSSSFWDPTPTPETANEAKSSC